MPTRSRSASQLPPPDPWLTAKEAADYTGYSDGWIRQLRTEGRGPRYTRTPTGRYRYRRSDLDAWLAGDDVAS